MGYKSDVRIIASKNGFEELKKFVENYLKNHKEDYNLLNKCDVKKEGKEQCYFGWDYVKWYENNFDDVDAIMKGLEYLKENNYSYRYMRIGEDKEDYDDYNYDSNRKDEPCLQYPTIFRQFDDSYVIDLISEPEKITVEESKESIDI